MALTLNIYTNTSERTKVDKSLKSLFALENVLLKDSCSLQDPTFIISWSAAQSGPKYLKQANYCYLSDWRRYYFITSITMLRNNLIEIACHVDVLMSFKSEIRANTAVLLRQENDYNLYLNDGVFKCYQNPVVLTREFPAGFTTHSYVLAVAGS